MNRFVQNAFSRRQAEQRLPTLAGSAVWLVVVICMCGLAPNAVAQSHITIPPKADACPPSIVDDAIEATSLHQFAHQIPSSVGNVVVLMESRGAHLGPAVRPRVLQALAQSFDPAALDEEFRRGVRSHCEPKIFAAALAQLKTPLGTKMRGLEDATLTARGRKAFLSYSGNLQRHPPTSQREALLNQMESVLHTTDFVADINAEVARAMYIGISGKSASDAETQALREKMMPSIRQSVRAGTLFAYRTASDEELELYITMLDGVEMRRFNTILKSVVENGLIRRSEVAAAMIQQIPTEARGAGPH